MKWHCPIWRMKNNLSMTKGGFLWCLSSQFVGFSGRDAQSFLWVPKGKLDVMGCEGQPLQEVSEPWVGLALWRRLAWDIIEGDANWRCHTSNKGAVAPGGRPRTPEVPSVRGVWCGKHRGRFWCTKGLVELVAFSFSGVGWSWQKFRLTSIREGEEGPWHFRPTPKNQSCHRVCSTRFKAFSTCMFSLCIWALSCTKPSSWETCVHTHNNGTMGGSSLLVCLHPRAGNKRVGRFQFQSRPYS